MDPTGRCPCIDGLPDPCTLCGAPADGVCGLDTVVEWKYRAETAEAKLADGQHRPLVAFDRVAEVREEWAEWTENFYLCPNTGEWVYKWAEDRVVAAVRKEPS